MNCTDDVLVCVILPKLRIHGLCIISRTNKKYNVETRNLMYERKHLKRAFNEFINNRLFCIRQRLLIWGNGQLHMIAWKRLGVPFIQEELVPSVIEHPPAATSPWLCLFEHDAQSQSDFILDVIKRNRPLLYKPQSLLSLVKCEENRIRQKRRRYDWDYTQNVKRLGNRY